MRVCPVDGEVVPQTPTPAQPCRQPRGQSSQSAAPPIALTRATPQQSCCFRSSLNGTGIAHSLRTNKRQACGAFRNQVNKVNIQTQACACRSTQFTDRLKAPTTQTPQGRVTGGRPPPHWEARTRTRGNTARKQGCPRHLDQRQTTRIALSLAQLQPREHLCAHAAVNRQQRGSAGQSTEHRPPSRSPGRAVPSGAVPGRAGCGDQAQAAAGHSRRIKYRIQLVFSLEIQSIRRIT